MATNLYSDGNLVTAEVISRMFGLKLGDRAALGMHPVIAAGYLGNLGASGSTVASRDDIDLGLSVLSATAEDTAVTPTAFTFESVSATVALQREGRRVSDLLKYIEPTGVFRDPAGFAFHAAGIYGLTQLSLALTAGATFTVDKTPGAAADLDWATVRAGKQALVTAGVDVTQGILCVLHPKQWGDLEDQMAVGTSLSDAMTHAPEAYDALLARSLGYQGNYFGIDFFTSTRVGKANADADYRGFMAGAGGIAWADASILPDADAHEIILDGGKMQIEFDRDPSKAAKNIFFNAIMGFAKGKDAAGVTITSQVA